MFVARRGKKPCLTCTDCRDKRKSRGPTKKHQECKAVHDAWKALQGSCSRCSRAFTTDDCVETDHIDETKKKCRQATFSSYNWYAAHGGPDKLKEDLEDNGQLLHTKCHREKTSAARKRKRDPEEVNAFTADEDDRTCKRGAL